MPSSAPASGIFKKLEASAPKPAGASGMVRRLKQDSYVNSLTGIGDTSRDKREQGTPFAHVELTRQNFEDMYRGDDLGGTLVEALPDEMMREGWRVHIEGDKEAEEKTNAYLEGLEFNKHLKEALYWSRQHGGAGILLGADDGSTDLTAPLNEKRIKSLDFFTTLTRWELYPLYYYGDPLAPKYGHPSVYYLQQLFGLPQEIIDPANQSGGGPFVPQSNSMMAQMVNYPKVVLKATVNGQEGAGVDYGKRQSIVSTGVPLRTVHESRFLLFDGVPVTRPQRVANSGWGDSVFIRVFEVLRDYNMSWAGVCNMLSDYAQGVYKLHGLLDLMLANDDGVVANRAMQIDMMRSLARAIVLDAGSPEQPAESFERQVANLTGLPEIMQQLALRLAAAARMPISLLLGQAPAGLNATGDSDIRWYYDRIKSQQHETLLPPLKRLVKLLFQMKDGPTNGTEPDNWSIVFNPLWQSSNAEEATRRLAIAQADNIYLSNGVVTPQEVAISRFGDDTFNGDNITIDEESREKLGANTEEALKASAAELMVRQGKNPDGTDIDPALMQNGAQTGPGKPPVVGPKAGQRANLKAGKAQEDKASNNVKPSDEKRSGKKQKKRGDSFDFPDDALGHSYESTAGEYTNSRRAFEVLQSTAGTDQSSLDRAWARFKAAEFHFLKTGSGKAPFPVTVDPPTAGAGV